MSYALVEPCLYDAALCIKRYLRRQSESLIFTRSKNSCDTILKVLVA